MEELVTLNRKEQKRPMVLNRVEKGEICGREAAEVLGLSLCQVRIILTAYRKEGARALARGNRGRKPVHSLDEGLKKRALQMTQSTYVGCNTQNLTELLAER